MDSRTLLVGTYRPTGTYLGQEKTVQEQNCEAMRINVMAEVKKNSELIHQALRVIQGLKDLLMVILENTTSSPP